MIFYLYNSETFELVGSRDVLPDPRTGACSAPIHSTHIEPPTPGANQAAIFSETTGLWSLVPDFRKTQLYNVTTGAPISLSLGQEPDATMSETLPLSILIAKAQANLARSYSQALYGTFTDSEGNTWQVDSDSRAMMTGTESKIAGGMALPADFAWKNLANVFVSMTAAQFQSLTAAIFHWTQNVFAQYQEQKTIVGTLGSPAAVEAYTVPAWPTS